MIIGLLAHQIDQRYWAGNKAHDCNVVDAHTNQLGIIQMTQLDTSSLVSQEKPKYEQQTLVTKYQVVPEEIRVTVLDLELDYDIIAHVKFRPGLLLDLDSGPVHWFVEFPDDQYNNIYQTKRPHCHEDFSVSIANLNMIAGRQYI